MQQLHRRNNYTHAVDVDSKWTTHQSYANQNEPLVNPKLICIRHRECTARAPNNNDAHAIDIESKWATHQSFLGKSKWATRQS